MDISFPVILFCFVGRVLHFRLAWRVGRGFLVVYRSMRHSRKLATQYDPG